MRNIFKFIFIIIIINGCTEIVYAQRDEKQHITREQLAKKQAEYIAKVIAMDKKNTKKFTETFCSFQKEVWALGMRPKNDISNRSEYETEQYLKEKIAHAQKILDLRKKYYTEYSKFLTQKEIEQVYKLEKEIMDRLHRRSQKRKVQ